ncbi:MAG: cation transporter [Candidatus Marinimicrobia bacterium]|nr:cation transporter [Candidatus Neomarinimicrobiota bacterium]MBL7022870.1 cation transporter [Candidatus Neomarinimicrobiota bacterium]MBL7109189.1 cation transporter [Candidatus Neomarinimicrobiota bacterium]
MKEHQMEKFKLYRWAITLAIITVFYNVFEGLVSIYFGMDDETLSLFGFGVDSFVEVISGIGIWHMVIRLKRNGEEQRDGFERTALRITGSVFYLLVATLVISSVWNLITHHQPETTFWGIVISSISIFTMWLLIHYKKQIGGKLNSQAIIADANCTKTCMYLSITLLIASTGYELTGFGGIDAIGSLIIAGFAFKEGKESFDKSNDLSCSCCSCD